METEGIESLRKIETAIKWLGNNGAATELGAIENLAIEISKIRACLEDIQEAYGLNIPDFRERCAIAAMQAIISTTDGDYSRERVSEMAWSMADKMVGDMD